MIRTVAALALGSAVAALAGCSDDAPGPDVTFTGAYEDWDSTEQDFLGIPGAVVAQAADPTNSTTAAPNGRSTLLLPGAPSEVTYTHPSYVPARYTVEPSAYLGGYDVRGIALDRIAGFYAELGVGAWDESTALVELEVRREPSGADADGVTVTVGGAAGFRRAPDASWTPGTTTAGGGGYVVFPNVPVGDGTIAIDFDAGPLTCHAPAALRAVAGEVAMTTIACDD